MKELADEKGYKKCHLEYGDYESDPDVNGKVLRIERKSDDFLQSIWDRSIYNQLKRMNNAPSTAQSYLILDKLYSHYRVLAIKLNISEEIIFGGVSKLCVLGFPPMPCESKYEAIGLIDSLMRRHVDGKSRDVHEKTIIGGENLLVFPGVDVVLGKRLLAKFGTFKNVANANQKSLMEVDGIGPTMADRIYSLCNKEYGVGDSDEVY
jgi:ERCC4-type nuclease